MQMDDDDKPLDNAATVLESVLGRMAGGFGSIIQNWNAAVGPAVAAHSTPTSLREGVLKVRCNDAMWASELQHLAPQIVTKLRQSQNTAEVLRISCYVGRTKRP